MRIMQSILSFLAALYLVGDWVSAVSENIRRSSNSDLLDIWSKWWWLTPWPAPWSIQWPTSIPTPWKIHWSRPSLWSWPKSEFKIVMPGQFCTLVMFLKSKINFSWKIPVLIVRFLGAWVALGNALWVFVYWQTYLLWFINENANVYGCSF